MQKLDENNANTSEYYRAIIQEFENSIIGKNSGIIYKCLVTSGKYSYSYTNLAGWSDH